MKPTDELKQEHELIKRMIAVLKRLYENIDELKEVSIEDIEAVLNFIIMYADKYHHEKEEVLLFPAMQMAGISNEGGPIEIIAREHVKGRIYTEEMKTAIAKYKNGKKEAISDFVRNAKYYAKMLPLHIELEDKMLYLIADLSIPKEKQDKLMEKFQEIKMIKVGDMNPSEFEGVIKQLEDKYIQ